MSTHEFVQSGRELNARGDFQEAVKVCRRGLLAHPTAVEGRLVLGRALMALRRYGEVVAEMRVVLDGAAQHPDALALKGEALLLKGEVGKAFQDLKQAHELTPGDMAVAALFRRAEHEASSSGDLDFEDDDPSAGRTQHYPLNQMPGTLGGMDVGPPTIPLKTRTPQATEEEPGAGEIYLEADAVAKAGADLIEELLDAPAVPTPAGSRSVSMDVPGHAAAESTEEIIEEISDDLVEEIRSSSSMSLTRVMTPGDPAKDDDDDDGASASRNSSFDEPTVIYRSSEPRLREAASDAVAAPAGPAGDASVATDHYPSLSGSAAAPQGKPSGSPAAGAPGGPSVTAGFSPLVPSLVPEQDGDYHEDDDEPPTQMIPLDGPWRSSRDRNEGSGTQQGAAPVHVGGQRSRPVLPVPPPPPPAPPPAPAQGGSPAPAALPTGAAAGPGGPPPMMQDRPVLERGNMPAAAAPAMPLAPEPPSVPAAAAASGRGRGRASASHGPTAFVKRQKPGRGRYFLYALAAVVVIGAGAAAGLKIRQVRLEREIAAARDEAAIHVQRGTYAGHVHARRAYDDILAVLDESPADQAALARILAVLAADHGEGLADARAAVGAVESVKNADAAAARAYLAVADGDAAAALGHAREVQSLAPEDPHGYYLAGGANLLAGENQAAASAFEEALSRDPRPMFHVGLGLARLAGGALDQAEAAFRSALELTPGYPAAVLGLAEVTMARQGEVPAEQIVELQSLVEKGTVPLAEQEVGVSPRQAAQALLAVASLRLMEGNEEGAREAIERALATGREGDPVIALDLARVHNQMGDTEAALAQVREVVQAFPARLDARVVLARIALAAGDAEAALAALPDGRGDGVDISGHALALALRGRARLDTGDLDGAAGDLDAALAQDADLLAALVARAEIDLRQGDAAAAVERLEPMVGAEVAPDEVATGVATGVPAEARVVYAAALRQSGQLEKARQVIQALVEGPAAGRAHLELARLERRQGNFDRAREAYAKAAERLPGADARLEAALLAFDTRDRQGAREMIAALAEAFAGSGRVLIEAARIHTLTGHHDDAVAYLDAAEALDAVPRWQIQRERGRLALRSQDTKAAISALEQALEGQGRDAEIYLLLIEAHLERRDNAAAGRVRDQVLERFEEGAPIRELAAGRVAATSTEPDDSIQAYARARALLEDQGATPRELDLVSYLVARTYYYADNLLEAKKVLKGLLRRDAEHADVHFVLGLVEYALDEPRGAIAAFEKAIALDARAHPDAWFYLGEVRYQNDMLAQAGEAFRAYIEHAPEGEHVSEAKAYLDELK